MVRYTHTRIRFEELELVRLVIAVAGAVMAPRATSTSLAVVYNGVPASDLLVVGLPQGGRRSLDWAPVIGDRHLLACGGERGNARRRRKVGPRREDHGGRGRSETDGRRCRGSRSPPLVLLNHHTGIAPLQVFKSIKFIQLVVDVIPCLVEQPLVQG